MSGFAEFDNARVTATFFGGSGDFSGDFSATTVNATSALNFHGQAVAAYYGFTLSPILFSERYVGGQLNPDKFKRSFVLPAQSDQFEVNILLSCLASVGVWYSPGIFLYRNGVKVLGSGMQRELGSYTLYQEELNYVLQSLTMEPTVVKLTDPSANTLIANTYEIQVPRAIVSGNSGSVQGFDHSGTSFVEIVKR